MIPVFNEAGTVAEVVRQVLERVPFDLEVIAVNDGSTDRTVRFSSASPRKTGVFRLSISTTPERRQRFERHSRSLAVLS